MTLIEKLDNIWTWFVVILTASFMIVILPIACYVDYHQQIERKTEYSKQCVAVGGRVVYNVDHYECLK